MTVYVDRLQRYGAREWCHVIADTVEELHAAMTAVGAKRSWFQPCPPASFPHYDLQRRLRAKAIAHGAIECDRLNFVVKMRTLREASKS